MNRIFRLAVVAMIAVFPVWTANAAESVEQEIADGYNNEKLVEWINETTGGKPISINPFRPKNASHKMYKVDLFRTPLLHLENGGKSIVVEEDEGTYTDWTLDGTVSIKPALNTAVTVKLTLSNGDDEGVSRVIKFQSPNVNMQFNPIGVGTPVDSRETLNHQVGIIQGVANGYVVAPHGSADEAASGESPAVKGRYEVRIVNDQGVERRLTEYQLKSREKGNILGEVYQCTFHKGDVFRLLVTNKTDYDAAFEVYIDGVSALALWENQDDKPDFFIVGKEETCEVPGWLLNGSGTANSLEFVAGCYKDSVARKLCVTPELSDGKSEISFLFRRAGDDVKDLGTGDATPAIGAGNKIDALTESVDIKVASKSHCKVSVWYSVQ